MCLPNRANHGRHVPFRTLEGKSAERLALGCTISSHRVGQRPPELLHLPTWSWASARAGIAYHRVDTTHVRVTLLHLHHKPHEDQSPQHIRVTGKALPAWLKTRKPRPTKDEVELGIDKQYLSAEPSSWPQHQFWKDFDMRTRGTTELRRLYEVKLIRFATASQVNFCLVVWNY
jgi:hypothetical protein